MVRLQLWLLLKRWLLLHAPDMYMEKLCVGPRGAGAIDITKSLTENIKNVAAK